MNNYKDFAKHDPRRILVVLLAIEDLGHDATTHYIAQRLDCARVEVQRAIESAQRNFLVEVEKEGSTYKLTSWGILDKERVVEIMSQKI